VASVVLAGRVTEFDADRGLGVVTTVDGVAHPFHCIEIAGGSREIEVGAEVDFELVAKLGRYEAAAVRSR
jgi:cold shock CspA family protein